MSWIIQRYTSSSTSAHICYKLDWHSKYLVMHGIYQANSLQRKIRMLVNEYSLEFVSQQCKSDYFITVLSIWGTEISAGMKKWISTQCCELHTKRKYTWAVSLGEILLQVYFLIDHFFLIIEWLSMAVYFTIFFFFILFSFLSFFCLILFTSFSFLLLRNPFL